MSLVPRGHYVSVNRTSELLAMIATRLEDADATIAEGASSVRIQWPIEGYTDPLTLLVTRDGASVVEPGVGRVPARDWLDR
jgi:hypothetical protein